MKVYAKEWPDCAAKDYVLGLEAVNAELLAALKSALDMARGIDAVGMTDIRDCLRAAIDRAKEE